MNKDDIFETYQQEYTTLRASITQKLQVDIPNASAGTFKVTLDQKRVLSGQVERDLEEADEIISHMEIELQSLPLPVKTQLNPRMRQFKDEVKKFKVDFKALKSSGDRDSLLGKPDFAVDMDEIDLNQRDRALRGAEKLQDGSRRLEEAKRVAMETGNLKETIENVGISTLETLNTQREQILRTRDTLQNADGWVAKSTSLLKTMQRRLAESKMLSWIMIALLVILIIIVIYLKWIS